MPFFDENPLDKLQFQPGDAETTLDLQGMPPDQAMRTIEALLDAPGDLRSCLIRFDGAAGDVLGEVVEQ